MAILVTDIFYTSRRVKQRGCPVRCLAPSIRKGVRVVPAKWLMENAVIYRSPRACNFRDFSDEFLQNNFVRMNLKNLLATGLFHASNPFYSPREPKTFFS